MKPPPLRYVRPGSVTEAVALLDSESRPLAGGQSLIPLLNLRRQSRVARLVDLAAITELQRLEVEGDELVIGAGITMGRVEGDLHVRRHAAVLVDALALVGNPQVRARGTIGGNIAHRDPVSEVATTLVAVDATATAQGPSGTRRACVEDLQLADDELLVDVRIPLAGPGTRGAIHEVAARYAARALVVATALVRLDSAAATLEHARVAVGGVATAPATLPGLDAVRGLRPDDPRVAETISAAVAALPLGVDPRAEEAYRRQTAAQLALRALCGAAGGPARDRPVDRRVSPAVLRTPAPDPSEHDDEVEIELTVNGHTLRERVEPRTLLSDLIRGQLGLRSTHVGCEHGVCGACNVLVDGVPIRSCLMLAIQADGRELETVEGLRDAPEVAEIIERFVNGHALQCGFCTPGFMVTLADLRRRGVTITPELLVGNICRCTGYAPILRVVEELT